MVGLVAATFENTDQTTKLFIQGVFFTEVSEKVSGLFVLPKNKPDTFFETNYELFIQCAIVTSIGSAIAVRIRNTAAK